ncbi:MAG: hypothetical protein QXE76_04455 [Candidatus Bathyarchaeia archaeon]
MKPKMDWRITVFAIIIGCLIGLASGLVERKPDLVTIPEKKYYGVPFIWRSTDPFIEEKHYHYELLLNCVFWTIITFIALLIAKMLIAKG